MDEKYLSLVSWSKPKKKKKKVHRWCRSVTVASICAVVVRRGGRRPTATATVEGVREGAHSRRHCQTGEGAHS
jgi:hypothetical protein